MRVMIFPVLMGFLLAVGLLVLVTRPEDDLRDLSRGVDPVAEPMPEAALGDASDLGSGMDEAPEAAPDAAPDAVAALEPLDQPESDPAVVADDPVGAVAEGTDPEARTEDAPAQDAGAEPDDAAPAETVTADDTGDAETGGEATEEAMPGEPEPTDTGEPDPEVAALPEDAAPDAAPVTETDTVPNDDAAEIADTSGDTPANPTPEDPAPSAPDTPDDVIASDSPDDPTPNPTANPTAAPVAPSEDAGADTAATTAPEPDTATEDAAPDVPAAPLAEVADTRPLPDLDTLLDPQAFDPAFLSRFVAESALGLRQKEALTDAIAAAVDPAAQEALITRLRLVLGL